MPTAYDTSGTYDSAGLYDTGLAVASTFTPPLVQDRPTFLPDSTEMEKGLWQHFENRIRGVNVWILSDGSVVQDTATVENSNTNMSNIYPWNPNDPDEPYVTSVYIDAGANPQIPSVHTTSHNPFPVAFFAGGSSYSVTPAQVTLLTNYTAFGTGYADRLT
jgi:hypothetical protein